MPYLPVVACTLYHVHIHIVHKVSHLRHVLYYMDLVRRPFSILEEKIATVNIQNVSNTRDLQKVFFNIREDVKKPKREVKYLKTQ